MQILRRGGKVKFIYDEKSNLQLVYDLGYKLDISDLQRVKMYRSYVIHGFEFRYTANGTIGYVYMQVGTNRFYVAEYDYKYGEWFMFDVLSFCDGSHRITKKCLRYR